MRTTIVILERSVVFCLDMMYKKQHQCLVKSLHYAKLHKVNILALYNKVMLLEDATHFLEPQSLSNVKQCQAWYDTDPGFQTYFGLIMIDIIKN